MLRSWRHSCSDIFSAGKLHVRTCVRTKSAAAILTLLFFGQIASAASAPLKLLTCEAILAGTVAHRVDATELMSVFDRVKVGVAHNLHSPPIGPFYSHVRYLGDEVVMSNEEAITVWLRISGIEEDVFDPDSDVRSIAAIVRGRPEVGTLLNELASNETRLARQYTRDISARFPRRERIIATAAYTAPIVAGGLLSLLNDSSLATAIFGIIGLGYWRFAHKYHISRLDRDYPAMKAFLRKMVDGQPTNTLFYAGTSIQVPENFLWGSASARQAAIENSGSPSYFVRTYRHYFRKRRFRNLPLKTIYLDYLALNDPGTREPLLIVLARAPGPYSDRR